MIKISSESLYHALRWIQNSPPLFGQSAGTEFLDSALSAPSDYFLPSDEDIRQLQTIVTTKNNHLLGIYYETLWQFILDQSENTTLTANNLQVQGDHGTLGEFDLIYQHQGQYIHRELALKFYLGIATGEHKQNPQVQKSGQISPWNHWVGPGLKDRLDRKLQRLSQHQIRLGKTNEGEEALYRLGIRNITREILIQGILFYPIEGHCPPPEFSHPDHLRDHFPDTGLLKASCPNGSTDMRRIYITDYR